MTVKHGLILSGGQLLIVLSCTFPLTFIRSESKSLRTNFAAGSVRSFEVVNSEHKVVNSVKTLVALSHEPLQVYSRNSE